MTDFDEILGGYQQRLDKALTHLRYSAKKVALLASSPAALGEEELETWESFATRHARVVDLFLTKYLRAYVLRDDPGFSGSLRDFANQGEKLGLIDSADDWMALRELRNVVAHEYSDHDAEAFFRTLRDSAARLLALSEKLSGG